MRIWSRLLRRGPQDPYWDRFVNGPIADPANDIAPALRTAPPGKVFPIKSELPDPERLAQDLAEFARFLGAPAIAVAEMDNGVDGADDGYPRVVVCVVPAEYDPEQAVGIGGQHARREAASVNFSIAAYIRELGYRAIVHPADAAAIAEQAGLVVRRSGGGMAMTDGRSKVFVGDVVLTDLPVATGVRKG